MFYEIIVISCEHKKQVSTTKIALYRDEEECKNDCINISKEKSVIGVFYRRLNGYLYGGIPTE